MTDDEIALAFRFPEGIDAIPRSDRVTSDCMSGLSPFDDATDGDDRKRIVSRLHAGDFANEEDRAMGAILGLAVGDALGSPLEFSPLRYGSHELTGFDAAVWNKAGYNRFALKPGQWTDDTSMALCLADSLLVRNGFDAHDLRLRFLNWWHFGYCNAFGYDTSRPAKNSVGLGGNIWQSFEDFVKHKTGFTTAGDSRTSGNGSLMRNAPVAIFYRDDPALAQAMSYNQSKTTHQGEEAAEGCRLLTHCILRGLNGDGSNRFLETLASEFRSSIYSVTCLANAEQEARHADNASQPLEDRNWNWKSDDFRYSPTRAREHPDYIGSYAMDALSMALHCVWSTASFAEAVLKCANLCGDSDTTAAITGQIAGAIYGVKAIPADWTNVVLQWDPQGDIPLRAHNLFLKQPTTFAASMPRRA